eukprot:4580350-Lingulodinium_polyedra.AAC.1
MLGCCAAALETHGARERRHSSAGRGRKHGKGGALRQRGRRERKGAAPAATRQPRALPTRAAQWRRAWLWP